MKPALLSLMGGKDTNRREIFDIERMAYMLAAHDSARFFMNRMRMAENLVTREALLAFAVSKRSIPGLTMEFGVAGGGSLRTICNATSGPVYGFDSFQGLPEDWTHFQRAGRFGSNGAIPRNLPANAKLVVGLFENTLPKFLDKTEGQAAFVHIDSDLYSSAKTVLECLSSRIAPGAIVLFDEYLNYPGWQHHEHKALSEYLKTTSLKVEYIGFASSAQSVAIRFCE